MKATFLLCTYAAITLAAPTITWTPELGSFYAAVGNHIEVARSSKLVAPPTCDLSKVTMPVAPSPLPRPTGTLQQIAVGRGIQNYTCANASPSVTPVAVGAVANLYNVSCIASNYQDIFQMLPTLALQYPLPPDSNAPLEPSNLVRSGQHYFNGAGIPTFDLTLSQDNLGLVNAKVANKSAVPVSAIKGQNGVGDGSVPWLMLSATNTSTSMIKTVYRINTAGGQPPADCSSSPAYFSVQYAAEYWFYS